MSEYGRIDDDGTVVVVTDGVERVVGSWQAGTREEGLAFYTGRYDQLAADVRLLEKRVELPTVDPRTVGDAATTLQTSLADAAAIGDLAALDRRLAAVVERAQARKAERAQARAEERSKAADAKRAIVAEATELAGSDRWKVTGERFRALVEAWSGIRGVERSVDTALWKEFSAARRSFDARRRAHFAALDEESKAAGARKEELVRRAEKLTGSDDWAATAREFRDLMTQWKAAGRARRSADDELWARFKAAQDGFFARRSEVFSARDSEQAANLETKQALLAEAEGIDPVADPTGAKRRLRQIGEKWDAIGHVPRDARAGLEQRFAAAERRVRDAGAAAASHVVVTDSPIVVRLRESLTKLESRLERARSGGDDRLATETEAAITTQREWLEQAERSGR
jgi:hypothetical protein